MFRVCLVCARKRYRERERKKEEEKEGSGLFVAMNSSEGYLKSDYPPAFLGMNMMNSSEGYLKSDCPPALLGMNLMNSPDMKMKRDNPNYPWDLGSGSGSGYSKRQKKKQEEEEEEDNTPQVEFRFPGQDIHSGRRGGGGRRGSDRYSLREFRDPRLGHAQFLKDKSLNPFITLPPKYQRPDFVQNPDNPVVGFRFIGTGPPIPITAVDIATETAKHEYPRLSPYGGTGPPLRFSESDLLKRSIQQSKEEAKKLDDMVRNEAEELRKGDLRLAQEAIKFYNATHGTSYEVVTTLGSYHHLDRGHWYHCNFRARDTKRRSSQPKLFFSELFCPGADMIGAKVCKMLDGPGQRPHTVLGCKICGDLLLHPVNGFECGK